MKAALEVKKGKDHGTKTNVRGGPKLPQLRLNPAEKTALDGVERRLKCQLHPLSRAVPLPPPDRLAELEKALKTNGWSSKLALVHQGNRQSVLGDVGMLCAWSNLGGTMGTIPQAYIEAIGEDDALVWHLTQLRDGLDWTPGRKAASAAAVAWVVSANLPRLRAATGMGKNCYTKELIKKLCGATNGLVGYALKLLRCKLPTRFRGMLVGERGALRAVQLEGAAVHGHHKRKSEFAFIDPLGSSTPSLQNLAHVVLVDSELVILDTDNARNVLRMARPRGFVIYVSDSADPQDAPVLSWLNSVTPAGANPFRLVERLATLRRVSSRRGQGMKILHGCALVFSRSADPFHHPKYRGDRQRDTRVPLNTRPCRIVTCERILRAFCTYPKGRVFVPCFPSQGSPKKQTVLACLKSAADRRRVEITAYG